MECRVLAYPLSWLAWLAKCGHLLMPVIGVARSEWDDEKLRQRAHDAVAAQGEVDEAAFQVLAQSLSFLSG